VQERIAQTEKMKGNSSDFHSTQLTGKEMIVQMVNMKTHLSVNY